MHGSPAQIDGAIEPRLAPAESEPLVHASDNPLIAFMHGLSKACGKLPEDLLGRSDPIVRGGLYSLAPFRAMEPRFCFFSLHRDIAARLDTQLVVWLHLCPAESFVLRHRGRVSGWTGGLIRSAAEWTARHPVVPECSVPLRLADLPFAIALHRNGVGHLQAMLRYPFAAKWRRK